MLSGLPGNSMHFHALCLEQPMWSYVDQLHRKSRVHCRSSGHPSTHFTGSASCPSASVFSDSAIRDLHTTGFCLSPAPFNGLVLVHLSGEPPTFPIVKVADNVVLSYLNIFWPHSLAPFACPYSANLLLAHWETSKQWALSHLTSRWIYCAPLLHLPIPCWFLPVPLQDSWIMSVCLTMTCPGPCSGASSLRPLDTSFPFAT